MATVRFVTTAFARQWVTKTALSNFLFKVQIDLNPEFGICDPSTSHSHSARRNVGENGQPILLSLDVKGTFVGQFFLYSLTRLALEPIVSAIGFKNCHKHTAPISREQKRFLRRLSWDISTNLTTDYD